MSIFELYQKRQIDLSRFVMGKGKNQDFSSAKERRKFFVKRDGGIEFVRDGAVFRHDAGDGRFETATVLCLCDILNMVHVKYMLRIERPQQLAFEDGPRVINLRSFIEHFSERLSADSIN